MNHMKNVAVTYHLSKPGEETDPLAGMDSWDPA